MITLSDAQWVTAAVECMQAEYLVSLMTPFSMIQTPSDIDPANHLQLEMNDIEAPEEGRICPREEHVQRLLEFGDRLDEWSEVVVHCSKGMHRSPAAVMILMAQRNPGREAEIAEMVFRGAPNAWPNSLILEIGDRLLGCDGALLSKTNARSDYDLTAQSTGWGSLDGFESFPLYLPDRDIWAITRANSI